MFILSFRQKLSWADAAPGVCTHVGDGPALYSHMRLRVFTAYTVEIPPDESCSRTKEISLSLEELRYVLWTRSLSVGTKEIVRKITGAKVKPEQLSAERLLLKCGRIPLSFEKQWDGWWRSAEDVLSVFRCQSWNKKLLIRCEKMGRHYFSKPTWTCRLQGQLSWSPAPLDGRMDVWMDERKEPFCHKKQ